MRILVVEDEKEISKYLKNSFEAEYFKVDIADNGREALEKINKNKYDLVTMDYSMPELNGMEALQEIRKREDHIPVLMLSVKSETNTKVDILNAGADDYLTKPFSLDELLARSRALLRRPKNIKNIPMEIDDLKLDIRSHVVKRARKTIKLTKKEFLLLEYFLKNRGIVLTRAMIMDQVWDMSADPFSNTIESHVRSLRRKIDIPGKRKLIHTVIGRGYKLDLE